MGHSSSYPPQPRRRTASARPNDRPWSRACVAILPRVETIRLRSRVIFLVPIILAAALRLPGLALRPMHADEAVHADKFGTLLEGGRYAYDPSEYAVIDIRALVVIGGRLPPRALGMAIEWASQHRDELLALWELAANHQPLHKLPPLE